MYIKEFFEQYYKPYTIYDTERSIADVIDGLKITQRKVIATCIKKNITTDYKVAQLGSLVSGEMAYHHGEAGVADVISKMAQDFTGSNNINLLVPEGQFGNILSPIPSAPRYIFTYLSDNFRKIFKKEDDLILEFLYDDGNKIEPKRYIPIIPMVLVNGTKGVGTGYASKVFNYNPKDIKQDILNVLNGKKRVKLTPFYKDFKGTITQGENDKQWLFKGKLEVVNTTTIRITELPIGTYQDDYLEVLKKLKEQGIIKDFDDNSTVKNRFDIEINAPRNTTSMNIDKLYETFKLISKDTENYTLWGVDDKLKIFDSTKEIIDYFIDYRLLKYEERRLAQILEISNDIFDLEQKIRFINFYIKNHKVFKDSSKKELIELLEKNKFVDCDKLLSMAIWNLTKDRIEQLQKDLDDKKLIKTKLETETAKDIYIKELTELKL